MRGAEKNLSPSLPPTRGHHSRGSTINLGPKVIYTQQCDIPRSFDAPNRAESKEHFFPAHCGCTYSSRSSDHAPRVSKPLITHRINLRSEPYRAQRRYFSWQLIPSLPPPSPRPFLETVDRVFGRLILDADSRENE